MQISDEEIKNILGKYDKKFNDHLDDNSKSFSLEYKKFKDAERGGKKNWYESWCDIAERIIPVKVKDSDIEKVKEAIRFTGLRVTPTGTNSFGVLIGVAMVLVAILYLGLMTMVESTSLIGAVLFSLIFILIGVAIIKPLSNLIFFFEQRKRLETSNQMVICILYIVMYMRHTSNLEHALSFAAEHIGGTLAKDLKKVFWNIETGKYSTIKESLDNYLIYWRTYNPDFVNSLNLIEASLYEPSEQRRIEILDKSLKVMLEGNYRSMMHYAHDLKAPMEALHMLGVILPILGLVLIPLFAAFIDVGADTKIIGLILLYNISLPIFVYLKGMSLLSKRPASQMGFMLDYEGGKYEDYRTVNFLGGKLNPAVIAVLIFLFFFVIGISPLLMHIISPGQDFEVIKGMSFLGYTKIEEGYVGPSGIGALLISLFVPLGLALSLGYYYKAKSSKLVKLREDVKKIEDEFSSILFQLGNKIGDGLPAEIAFSKVAEEIGEGPSSGFFKNVVRNIQRLGMSIKDAIFNSSNGALIYYPSMLIMTSMKILVETVRKGPKIAADSLMNISKYIENLNSASERLKDLLAEVVSSMKSQINFLTPLIAGIVVGIGSMIISILSLFLGVGKTSTSGVDTGALTEAGASGLQGISGISEFFNPANIIPTYYFQIIVGVYVLEIALILTILANSIDNGGDQLSKEYALGKNLYKSTFLYMVVALIVVTIFNLLAMSVASKVA